MIPNPSLDWVATRVVRGENTAPIGPTSGVQIMDGTETEFTDTYQLKAGVRYIYAYFPRNEAGNYQMSATTAEITIPTKVPQPPTNLQIKNSTDAGTFAATLTYEAPVDVYRDHFAIVRKEGSAPTSLEDGKIVYEGTELTFRDTQSTNFGVEYFWTVFAVNAEGTVSDGSPSVSLTIQPIVPEQVTELTATDASAPEYGYRVMVKCKKPADVNAYKIMVRRKAGEMPATSIDGEQVYEGSNEIFYDMPVFSSQAYYYRAFTINQVGQMNDEQEGAVASVTLTAKEPGNITNLAASDEKGTTTGSFDLPVVMLEGREVVNRFVAGYVVIQKEGSTPESETDGEVIESRDIDPTIAEKTVTFTKTEQKNGANLFITVFLKNHAGSYFWTSGQVVNVIPETKPVYEYSGKHEYIDDGDGNWRIKFTTSGKLRWLSSITKIDIFGVGGGGGGGGTTSTYGGNGGGGGSGYTKTVKLVEITNKQEIDVVIGAGGRASSAGGTTTFGNILSVNGGQPGGTCRSYDDDANATGGAGGSGGGPACALATYTSQGNPGSDGNSGTNTYTQASQGVTVLGGRGQGTTTREFGESGGPLHAGGGQGVYINYFNVPSGSGPAGQSGSNGNSHPTYRGGKGGGGYGGGGGGSLQAAGGAGSAGVVIIRNSRESA